MASQANLIVKTHYTRDTNRGVCRIDYDTMDSLGISTGDYVLVRHTFNENDFTVVKVLPLYPSDEGKGFIRLDNVTRKNISNVSFDEKVIVTPTKVINATKIILKQLEPAPHSLIEDPKFFADVLESMAFVLGDQIQVLFFGAYYSFQIIQIVPEVEITQGVRINLKTFFEIQKYAQNVNQELADFLMQPREGVDTTVRFLSDVIKSHDERYWHTRDMNESLSHIFYHLSKIMGKYAEYLEAADHKKQTQTLFDTNIKYKIPADLLQHALRICNITGINLDEIFLKRMDEIKKRKEMKLDD